MTPKVGVRTAGGRRDAGFTPVLSPSRMGDVNRSRVLQALCDMGPLTRADLARMAGVPRATISGIVKPLLDSRLLEEGSPDRTVTRVGKPGRPLWFRSGAGLTGAVALRADACEAALVSARGEVMAHHAEPLSDPTDVRAVHRDILRSLNRALGRPRPRILGIGVAVPGACDPSTGFVLGSSQIPALMGHELGRSLEAEVDARVLIDNDSRAQALGEKWFGEGRGFRHFAAVQTGHGLGVGLVLAGQVFRGSSGQVGEIGHTPVAPDGARCACGLRGCWETIATLRWVRAEARRARLPRPEEMDAATLVALAEGGSSSARDLMERYAVNLAIGLAFLVQLLNPDRVILHGDAVGGGEAFREAIADQTRARTLPHLLTEIVVSTLDQQAGLLGAAGLVLSETFNLAT